MQELKVEINTIPKVFLFQCLEATTDIVSLAL